MNKEKHSSLILQGISFFAAPILKPFISNHPSLKIREKELDQLSKSDSKIKLT